MAQRQIELGLPGLIDHSAMEENTVERFKNIIFKGYFCGTLPVTTV